MADKKWKVVNPVDGAEFECTARNQKLAYDAARDAGFVETVNGRPRGIGTYIIQEVLEAPQE